ncbi:MAG TPA: tetratricopeptide repeat protein, partial [Bacteroidia bacterium]|nr:tetratricopeptide repeat protein [Bacteroidia bacterium]
MKSISCKIVNCPLSTVHWIICFFLFIFHFSFKVSAQDNVADSLKSTLKTERDDTNKVNTLKLLADRLRRTGKFDTALVCAKSLEQLSKKLSNKKGIAIAFNISGVIYRLQGEYPKAIENDFKALSIYQELGDKNGTAVSLGNIGLVYWNQGAPAKALNYDFRAL